MNTNEVLKLALEALENSIDLVSHEARNAEELYGKYPSRLARIQGLVAFEVAHEKAITALREALAEQPAQQEPVAIALNTGTKQGVKWLKNVEHGEHLYTSPPAQRTWVRLTNNELQPIANEYRILFGSWVEDFARAIEAKLKEKNT